MKEWPGGNKVDHLFRAVEFGGEVGELLNAVKKFHRAYDDIMGNVESTEDIVTNMKEEVGDVVICLDLLCIELQKLGIDIDIGEATKAKFNKTSIKNGLVTRML